ncbi:MAG: monooxygenase [Aeromicrobium sp.]
MRSPRVLLLVAGATAGALFLGACSGTQSDGTSQPVAASPSAAPESAHSGHDGKVPKSAALRSGERFLDLSLPEPYKPKAPNHGTDDYRCFLLDPKVSKSAFVTGVDVVPGRPEVVHHVIMFRVGPGEVAEAKAQDKAARGEGWTCFGGTGLASDPGTGLDSAPWLGAWAPGGGERLLAPDIGIPLEAGSRIVMQVHYNLRAGKGSDTTSARLRLAPGTAWLSPLETMLMPAPVELACRPGKSQPLCDREEAVLDVIGRFGKQSGQTIAGLQMLCDGLLSKPKASPVQHCDRKVRESATVRAVAGHMHLLGRSIKVDLNPGQPGERRLLDIPVWDFDNQGAQPLKKPAKLKPGDVLRVTCRHDQRLRDQLPALKGTPERYVVWGEGTTDEMCLGIMLLTKP